jgi:DNA-binding helix-hairpin-helix protein with protein kinase domain
VLAQSVWYAEYQRRRAEWQAAEYELKALQATYLGQVEQARRQRIAHLHRARDALARCRQLPREYADEVAGLSGRLRELAERAYLSQFILADATIQKIGEGRKQTLASHNILTAADVDPEVLGEIKGFGKALIGYLMAWRQECLAEFTFDHNQKVPEADQRAVAMKYRRQQQALFAEAERSLSELQAGPLAAADPTGLAARLNQVLARWRQARIDWEVFLTEYPFLRRKP